jgi:hypothetical protein
VPAGLEAQRSADYIRERGRVASGRPHLELGVASRPQLENRLMVAVGEPDCGEWLRMAAIEAFAEP